MIKQVPLRPPEQVMRLARLGSFHQSRLSFMRVLLRRLSDENWHFHTPDWQIDANGVGHAIYSVTGPKHSYSLIAFAHNLPDEMRSDRVIAQAWDTTFTLYDGIPTPDDIKRLSKNVPYQEAGRLSKKELSLSRANRSIRMWDYVVNCLAKGHQPDREKISKVGYVMRTTAVYGSGKFGAADRIDIITRNEICNPFQIEMLTVYLIRCFVMDLIEHMAKIKGGNQAVTLDQDIREMFGIGNSTGLGMAPFLVNHPALLHCWIIARETALARVRAISPTADDIKRFHRILKSAVTNAQNWKSDHDIQKSKIEILLKELTTIINHYNQESDHLKSWDDFYITIEKNYCLEVQEQIVSALIELYPSIVDDLSSCMQIDEASTFQINASGTTQALRKVIEKQFSWALLDYNTPQAQARFWYISEEKLEPRLGQRFEESGSELEQPLSIGRDICALYNDLTDDTLLADFLYTHPQYRHVIRRIQLAEKFPYSEIHDNLLDANMLPIDMLRCKLSFFGATKFDPRSDRWVRICMFQHAPYPANLNGKDNWIYNDGISC